MAKLILNPGEPTAIEFPLKPGLNRVGRHETNDLTIPHPSVSGSHCEVRVEDGEATIRDLDSTNGTFVEETRVREARLSNGQVLTFGNVRVLFLEETEGKPGGPQATVSASKPVVRLTGGPARAASAAPPSAPLAAPLPLDTAGSHPCETHPRTEARFACPQCRHYFCELCVDTRQVAGAAHKHCRGCGSECRALPVKRPPPPKAKGFFALLPGAFGYPFRKAGFLTVLGCAMVFWVLNVLGGGTYLGLFPRRLGFLSLLLAVVCYGYLFSYLQSVIQATANQEEELPSLPGVGSFWDDILLPFLQLAGLTLICFLPTLVLCVIAGGDFLTALNTGNFAKVEEWVLWIGIAYVAGLIYFPMAFLAVAVLDTVIAANPLVVMGSMLRVPLEYLATLALVGGLVGVGVLGDAVMEAVFPHGLVTRSMVNLFAFIALKASWDIVGVYLILVIVRILGLLYSTRRGRLGWLPR